MRNFFLIFMICLLSLMMFVFGFFASDIIIGRKLLLDVSPYTHADTSWPALGIVLFMVFGAVLAIIVLVKAIYDDKV